MGMINTIVECRAIFGEGMVNLLAFRICGKPHVMRR